MTTNFVQTPFSSLKNELSSQRHSIQTGKKRLACTFYGELVGFVVPFSDICNIPPEAIVTGQKMHLSNFKRQLNGVREQDLDVVGITWHNRPVMAFVSHRLSGHLPLSLIPSARS